MSSPASSISEGPFSLITTPKYKTGKSDQYTNSATEMALVHNCIFRGFNSIYTKALEVKASEYKDFISYAHALSVGLKAHHTGEEIFFFPAIEEATGVKGIMEVNVAQHEAFHDGLVKFEDYLLSFLTNQRPLAQFSGRELRAIIDSFASALDQHLHEEIDTLLSLSEFGDRLDLEGISAMEAKKVMAGLSMTSCMPSFLLNHDVTYEGGMHASFPPMPKPVKWVLMHILTMWHWKWWKFASCDTYGVPKIVQ